jgi:hypothetical protein
MKVILLTGPQGSGNHLWSKVFTTWADKEYWVGHKDEPHSNLWEDMDSWRTHKFSGDTVISISVPYAVGGNTTFPDIKLWKEIMIERGIDHKICAITRDGYINFLQNDRVRPENNYKESVEYIKTLDIDCFLSTETLLIYQWKYVEQVCRQLEFTIDKKDVDFSQSFNEKYVKYVEEFDLDKEVWEVSGIGERDPFVYGG